MEQEWSARWASSNSPGWRTISATIGGWLTFGVVLTLVMLGSLWLYRALLVTAPVLVAIAGWLGLIGLVGAIILGVVVSHVLSPQRVVESPDDESAVIVPAEIAQWAGDDLAHRDLWRLAQAYSRVEALETWREDTPYPCPAPWYYQQKIDDLLDDLEMETRTELGQVASELGFPVASFLLPRQGSSN